MQLSSIPTKIDIIWAQDAGSDYVRSIPDAVQQPTYPYAASWTAGFPPDTFLAPDAGGEGPDGRDMNGGLRAISAWARWQAAGGPIVYDSTFQSNIGGYPNRAIVGSATTPGTLWVSTADNNTTDPDSSGAGWVDFFAPVYAKCPLKNGTGATGTWGIGISGNAATASNASQLNGQAGSYYTGYAASVASTAQSNAETYAYNLIAAIPQAQGAFLQQIGTNTTLTPEVSFYAGGPGLLVAWGSRNNSSGSGANNGCTLYINGVSMTGDSTAASMSHMATTTISGAGTVSAQYTAAESIEFSANVCLVFIPYP